MAEGKSGEILIAFESGHYKKVGGTWKGDSVWGHYTKGHGGEVHINKDKVEYIETFSLPVLGEALKDMTEKLKRTKLDEERIAAEINLLNAQAEGTRNSTVDSEFKAHVSGFMKGVDGRISAIEKRFKVKR